MLSSVKSMMDKYYEFFQTFNVLGLAIGLMIGSNLKDVAGDFIDDVLMPFINPAIATFTTKNSKGKKGGVIFSVPGSDIEINLERVLASSIKFFALSIIIFFMSQFGVKIKKPVTIKIVPPIFDIMFIFFLKFLEKIKNFCVK